MSLHRGEGLLNRPVILFVGFRWPPRERRIAAMSNEDSTAPCLGRAVICGIEYVRLEVILGGHSSWLRLQPEQLELPGIKKSRNILHHEISWPSENNRPCIFAPQHIALVLKVLLAEPGESLGTEARQ